MFTQLIDGDDELSALERQVIAVAVADQVGAVLAAPQNGGIRSFHG